MRSRVLWVTLAAALLLLIGFCAALFLATWRPSLVPLAELSDERPGGAGLSDAQGSQAKGRAPTGGLVVQFFGVSTLSVCTRERAERPSGCVLVDGFFSRPPLLKVLLSTVSPDRKRIDQALAFAHFDSVAAVFVAHSHYDHLLDAPAVAQRFSAHLYGSTSTAVVARASGLPESQTGVLESGQIYRFEELEVRVFSSPHSPGGAFPGEIAPDFSPPSPVSAYKEGGSFSFGFSADETSLLVVPSANAPPEGFPDFQAQAIFLGIGGLGKQSEQSSEAYWSRTVLATGAREVVLIHWDDFTRPLSEPLVPLPYAADNLTAALQTLSTLAQRDRVQLRLPKAFQTFFFRP